MAGKKLTKKPQRTRRNLDAREKLFVGEYLVTLNPEKAALAAGYSKSVARTKAYLWVSSSKHKPHVFEAIGVAQQERAKRTEITADNVLAEIAKVAFADVRRIFDKDGGLVRISDLDDAAAACVAGCDLVTVSKGEGEVEHVAKIKLADKLKALELAGRHLGLFNDKLNLNADIHVLNVHRRAKKRQSEERGA